MIKVCDSCNVGLANDDWSSLDFHYDPEGAERVMATIEANCEHFGLLVPADVQDTDTGYFDCAICDEIAVGPGSFWRTT